MKMLCISLNMALTEPLCYLGTSYKKKRTDFGAGEEYGGVRTDMFDAVSI